MGDWSVTQKQLAELQRIAGRYKRNAVEVEYEPAGNWLRVVISKPRGHPDPRTLTYSFGPADFERAKDFIRKFASTP